MSEGAGAPRSGATEDRVAIRDTTPSDVPSIVALWGDTLPTAWSPEEVERAVRGRTRSVWLAIGPAPPPLGFIVAEAMMDRFEVHAIGVAPASRRVGVGRALMRRALVEARQRGCGRVDLEVAADNGAGLAFYRGLEFVAVGRRSRYYRGGGGRRADEPGVC